MTDKPENPPAFPTEPHERLAELLHQIGWRATGDAQWNRLRDAMPDIRAMLAERAKEWGE